MSSSKAFITSSKGPGHAISNLYFASWIGFIVSIGLFMSVLDDFKQKGASAVSGSSENPNMDAAAQPSPSNRNDEAPTEDVDL